MKLCIALAALAVTFASSCSTPAILLPPTGPHTDYPCGIGGVVCASGACCSEGEYCGGERSHADPMGNTCPAGACCAR